MAVASVRGTELLAPGNIAALSTAVDLTTIAVSADEEESLTALMTTDCMAEDGVGVILPPSVSNSGHPRPKVAESKD